MALRKITKKYAMGRFSDLRSMLTAVAFPEYSSGSLLGILSALHEQHPLQTIEYSNDWLVTDSHRLPYYYAQLHTPIFNQIILKEELLQRNNNNETIVITITSKKEYYHCSDLTINDNYNNILDYFPLTNKSKWATKQLWDDKNKSLNRLLSFTL